MDRDYMSRMMPCVCMAFFATGALAGWSAWNYSASNFVRAGLLLDMFNLMLTGYLLSGAISEIGHCSTKSPRVLLDDLGDHVLRFGFPIDGLGMAWLGWCWGMFFLWFSGLESQFLCAICAPATAFLSLSQISSGAISRNSHPGFLSDFSLRLLVSVPILCAASAGVKLMVFLPEEPEGYFYLGFCVLMMEIFGLGIFSESIDELSKRIRKLAS